MKFPYKNKKNNNIFITKKVIEKLIKKTIKKQ